MSKVGIEVHVTINSHKLHCACTYHAVCMLRHNAAIRSSLNSAQYKTYAYRYSPKHCAYELDDALPLPPSKALLKIAANVAKALNCVQLPAYRVERKIITDGSLVAGFQRTGIYARGGYVNDIRIRELRLEQDSCTRLGTAWHVGRQGLPLIEVTSEPFEYRDSIVEDLITIGRIVKKYTTTRGIGTIRQDLNVDQGLGKTELKGLQEPKLIRVAIMREQLRQRRILNALHKFHYRIRFLTSHIAEVEIKESANEPVIWPQLLMELAVSNPGAYIVKDRKIAFKQGFKLKEFISTLIMLTNGLWPTVRRVLPDGSSEYMRGFQSSSRYVRQPALAPIKTVNANDKERLTREERVIAGFPESDSSALTAVLNTLKPLGYIRYALMHKITKAMLDKTLTRYQLPWLLPRLIDNPKGFSQYLIDKAIAEVTATDLREIYLRHHPKSPEELKILVLREYRQKVYNVQSLVELINSSWPNFT